MINTYEDEKKKNNKKKYNKKKELYEKAQKPIDMGDTIIEPIEHVDKSKLTVIK